MKKLLITIFLIFLLYPHCIYAQSAEPLKDPLILEQLEKIDLKNLDENVQQLNHDLEDYFPKIDIKKTLVSFVKGEQTFELKRICQGILKYIFKEIIANASLLGKLIVLSILCAFLNNLSTSFESDALGKIAYMACYLMIISIAVKSFSIATSIGIQAIDNMVSFMQALLPVLLTFLMSVGAITSTALFQPVMVASVSIISTLMKDLIMPIIFFSVILSIVNNISSKVQVSRLASFLKQICIALIGFMLTIFIGIITVQGITASTTDGVTLRTAKFAADQFVPVIGGFISDAFDTIVGYSLLLKNATGALGLIVLAFIVIMPILKILSLIFIYKVTTAAIQPIAQNPLIGCLNDMSNAMILILSVVICVAIMFFLAVTMIVGAGNITMMMR